MLLADEDQKAFKSTGQTTKDLQAFQDFTRDPGYPAVTLRKAIAPEAGRSSLVNAVHQLGPVQR